MLGGGGTSLLSYEIMEHKKSKEWILMLHGFGGNHSIFYKQKEAFAKRFNLLLIDLPGHGHSQPMDCNGYSAQEVAKQVIEVMDKLKVKEAHIVAFSLGSIISNEIIDLIPYRVSSMVLAGAVIKWSWWSGFLVKIAYRLRFLASYMTFYKVFALLMMPRNNHRKAREIFIREASKLGRKEYMKWARLIMNPEKSYNNAVKKKNSIPKLYLQGQEDHMFNKAAAEAANNDPYADLEIMEGCGHVCIIEQHEKANESILGFIEQYKSDEEKSKIHKMVSSL